LKQRIKTYFDALEEAAPLAAFRIFFGSLMLLSILRFWYHGWIESLYIAPQFHFKYFGFEFVQVPGIYTYALFVICALSAIGVAIGYQYRWAIVVFFLSFTYIELLDKTTYLNHYYFISILSFLLIFLPANRFFSVDARRRPQLAVQRIPRWNIDAIKLLLAIVYIYAGAAKLNADWMLNALPLRIWLPSNYNLPLLGSLLQEQWVHYAFSWAGALYDLFIVFFLLYKPTRTFAFLIVVVFHLLTRILFPIGMFPYIMIMAATIFFSAGFHHRVLAILARWFHIDKSYFDNGKAMTRDHSRLGRVRMGIIAIYFIFQILFPWRYLLYPGNLFWTEEGYRFSWRVMLMEKTGYANFKVVDSETGKYFYVNNRDFLTTFQEKQMSTQADFILEFAHFLAEYYRERGHKNLQVFVESYVSLNGRKSRPYIDPEVDLLSLEDSFRHKSWILPPEESDKKK
jgi:hypothetical protein